MKKLRVLNITLWSVFLVWTVALLAVIYLKADSRDMLVWLATPYYFVFVIALMAYSIVFALFRLGYLRQAERRKRAADFAKTFVFLVVLELLFDHFVKKAITFPNLVSTPLGISFGVAFFDLFFKKGEDRLES